MPPMRNAGSGKKAAESESRNLEKSSTAALLDSATEDENGDGEGPGDSAVARGISPSRRVFILTSLAAGSFSSNLNSFAAFFTTAALDKHPSGGADYHAAVGAVYSISFIAGAMAIPLLTKDLPNIGSKNLMVLSYFVTGATQLMFAYVGEIQDWRVFLTYCYCIRILQGVAYVTSSVAVMSYLTRLYPADLGFVNGFQITFLGSGHITGILLSGLMYDIGGFKAPFLTSGVLLLIVSALVLCILVDIDTVDGRARSSAADVEKVVGVRTTLRSPWVWLMSCLLVLLSFGYGGLEANLGPRMRTSLHSPAVLVGVVLAVKALMVTISAPLVGSALDRGVNAALLQVVGLLLTACGFLLTAPATFLHLSPSLWMLFVGVVPLSIGTILIRVSCVVSMTQHLERTGVGTATELRVAVAGLSRFAITVGYVLGPLVFSATIAVAGFALTLTVVGFMHACVAGVVAVLVWFHHVALNVSNKRADFVKLEYADENDDL
ncbi:MFS-type transporter SLC18B1-like [Sycon ciliatum]|uniref:MFS-type transporter SLC18B1-like n=1 Tax=Sycon ciliatum TaxID=27933 RepID=UPI0031F654F7